MTDRILTPEIRDKLLGIMPFSEKASLWIVPDKYKSIEDEQFRASFEIRSFTKDEIRTAKKLLLAIKDSNSLSKEPEIIELTRKKVINWKNLFDLGTMEEIVFATSEEDDGASKKLFESIPASIQGQIFFEVIRISGLIDIEKVSLK
jgi:hypothetical protein